MKDFVDSRKEVDQQKTLAWLTLLSEKGPQVPRPYADFDARMTQISDLRKARRFMIHFRDHLKNKLKNKKFAEGFEKELHAVRLAVEIAQARENQGMSQSTLASKAHLTQQQLSKVENARPFKVETLFRVCDALDMELTLRPRARNGARSKSRKKPPPRPSNKVAQAKRNSVPQATGKKAAHA